MKSEREKSLAGELYLAADPELKVERQRARRLTRLFNASREDEPERREALLQELFGSLGPHCEVQPPFHCDYGGNIHVGCHFYANVGCVILDCHRVTIGDHVLLAPGVHIYAAYHPTDPGVRLTGRELAGPVTIGSNVWLGGGVFICPNVTIGDHTTIGAGSVVVHDIPASVVAAGNPCRVIRAV